MLAHLRLHTSLFSHSDEAKGLSTWRRSLAVCMVLVAMLLYAEDVNASETFSTVADKRLYWSPKAADHLRGLVMLLLYAWRHDHNSL